MLQGLPRGGSSIRTHGYLVAGARAVTPLCDSEIRGWPKNVVTDKVPSYFCTSI